MNKTPKTKLQSRSLVIALGSILFLSVLLPVFSAFEAHVVNVTAKIEPPLCDTRSIGFLANNEGCSHGSGSSDWDNEVQTLSAEYSSVFVTMSGGDMCVQVWMPSCPSGNTVAAQRCRALSHTLAVELNVVSRRLHHSAFLAGADDGDSAFNHLHLFENSTVQEALITLEAVLADSSASRLQLRDAAHVAERIYTFYESENPFHPRCVFDPGDLPQCRSVKEDDTVINENAASVINVVETATSTSGNSAEEGSPSHEVLEDESGDQNGGAVETGNTATETSIENEVNTNITNADCSNCAPCETPCSEVSGENTQTSTISEEDQAPSDHEEQPEEVRGGAAIDSSLKESPENDSSEMDPASSAG